MRECFDDAESDGHTSAKLLNRLNTAYGTGCASSLLAGMDATGEGSEALMLLLGDQPGVRPEFIDFALSRWRRERPWASVTSYRGELGHPFIFSGEAFGDLRGLHGDKAVWKLIEAYPSRVSRVEIEAGLPPDVDTPEDYEVALAHRNHGQGAACFSLRSRGNARTPTLDNPWSIRSLGKIVA